MKQLQNNYTTIEQSKKLLKTGIPVESADMFLSCGDNVRVGINKDFLENIYHKLFDK